MPELPEVEIIRRSLEGRVRGATIAGLHIHRDDIVRAGRPIAEWFLQTTVIRLSRRGKCLVFSCQGPDETRHIVSELGMTGLWLYDKTLAPSPQHIHVDLLLSGTSSQQLYYWNPRRFGRIWFLHTQELDAFCQRRFGPEALEMKESDFVALIKGCRGRLKPFLLDQHRIAGIGNIYANEILFRAGVHPHAHGNRLLNSTCHRLFQATHQVLQESITAGGSSIRDFRAPDGTLGQFQNSHQVYQKEGHPCPRGCDSAIKRLSGDRSSFFCPSCQRKR